MPTHLPDEISQEKNKLDTKSAWMWLLDITVPGVEDISRLVNNKKNISYGGNTYKRGNFTLGPWRNTEFRELPQRTLSITNLDLTEYMLPYVEDYDGAVGSTVVATPVNSEHLDIDMSSRAQEYMILDVMPTEGQIFESPEWITFILGALNPLMQIRTGNSKICPWAKPTLFKGPECQYVGTETSCKGTIEDCRDNKNNAVHWGAELGLDPSVAKV